MPVSAADQLAVSSSWKTGARWHRMSTVCWLCAGCVFAVCAMCAALRCVLCFAAQCCAMLHAAVLCFAVLVCCAVCSTACCAELTLRSDSSRT